MKRGIVITIAAVWLAFMGIGAISANYAYERTIHSYWSLSEKASSLEAKTAYLDKYVAAIEGAGLSGNNAVIFPTPDNSYEQNLAALKSLQQRMHEIQTMNVRSFEYQQAISQITAQEQGEARQMLDEFEGIWYLSNHRLLWDWIAMLQLVLCALLIIGCAVSLSTD